MDISVFFSPLSSLVYEGSENYAKTSIGNIVNAHTDNNGFPDLENIKLAIIGVEEERAAINNAGCANGPDVIRKYLYKLCQGNYPLQLADLGNIKKGHSIDDTYFAVKSAVNELIKNKIIPIIIGGSQDLTFANYMAYESLEQTVNIVSVDSGFDMGDGEKELNSQSHLSKIILHQPNFLFNYSNIGYQTYFVEQTAIDLMTKLYFDVYRLGQVRANMEEVEPIVRNADIVSFDISAIRYADAPANGNASPNGFYGEEACQITRYAGMSDKLTSIGFYEYNPDLDVRGQTAFLIAEMIWYFMDGFSQRKNDFPFGDINEYLKYHVAIKDNKSEIVFYKSNKSDRWWMSVPYPMNKKLKYERHHLVPCSYVDYETACKEEMPDRWWQTFQKLS